MDLKSQMKPLLIKQSADFVVTGKGDNNSWGKTDWVNIPQRTNDQVDYSTRVKVLYSDKGIYFLFDCEDAEIISTFTEDNANLYEEDVVEVFFWTDENHPFYFEYEISPNNYELPIFVPNVDGDFLGWLPWHYEGDRKTQHATFINKQDDQVVSWSAEFFIPFALLKPMSNVPPKSGTKWRANMYRIDHDKGISTFSWQAIRTNFHDFQRFGTFVFE
jgi:hypothetical protein